MITLIFTRTDESIVPIHIPAKVVYGTDFFDVRLNQFELLTADGSDKVYDTGPTVAHGMLVLKNVSYSDAVTLRTWVRDTLRFALYRFTISAITNVDLGLGKSTAITQARWDGGQSLSGVFSYNAPGVYTVNFPFRFTRS